MDSTTQAQPGLFVTFSARSQDLSAPVSPLGIRSLQARGDPAYDFRLWSDEAQRRIVPAMESQSTVAADWYPDPRGRHEHRYWDGKTWTDHVADGGQSSVDSVDPVAAESGDGQDLRPVDASDVESVLMTLARVSDVKWGGSANVYLTNRRLVVEPVLKTGAVIGSLAAGGLACVTIARSAAEKNVSREVNDQARTLDDILHASHAAYAVDYGDVATMVL